MTCFVWEDISPNYQVIRCADICKQFSILVHFVNSFFAHNLFKPGIIISYLSVDIYVSHYHCYILFILFSDGFF